MSPAFLPEVFFDFREVIKVIPAVHGVGWGVAECSGDSPDLLLTTAAWISPLRFLCRCRRMRPACVRRCTLAMLGRLIFLPNQAQTRQRQKFIGMLDVLRSASNQLGLAAGRDHLHFFAKLFFHAL